MAPRGDDVNGNNSGSSYVFRNVDHQWIEVAKLTPSDAGANDRFGHNIAMDRNVAMIGAPFAQNSGAQAGAVYVFNQANGNWSESQKLVSTDLAAADSYGISICIDGNMAVIGASGDNSSTGSAYVFEFNGVSWQQVAKLSALNGVTGDEFGQSVSIKGNWIVIGAWRRDSQRGAAYIFSKNGNNWTQNDSLIPSDGMPFDQFGYDVVIDSPYVFIGSSQF